ncbi:uncharacterized protein BP5553_10579 [Venustampulla echinocandica]|uniref:BZIP domain-containing protein n=1 Tax=Venustampulla echinocandica TaxID=2656787 RepID=A0A370T8Y7_9HELO|nr:uncharacterized protein BP5553_10579 [Venustampulla echinocandica]RDL29952.1 hypothetical protein BP5553_10579 [Venustampulla echinocandica]
MARYTTVRVCARPSRSEVAVKPPWATHRHIGPSPSTPYHLQNSFAYSPPTSETLFVPASLNDEAVSTYTQPAVTADSPQYQATSVIDYWPTLPETTTSFNNVTFNNPAPPLNLPLAQVNSTYDTLFDEYSCLSNFTQSHFPQYGPSPSNHANIPFEASRISNSPSPQALTPMSKPPPSSSSRVEKRTKNTLAARRYRQKRVDQINDLEVALKDTQMERDVLKVRVARLEGEAEALRQILRNRDRDQ